jgi:uncharacterized protein YqhQ
MDFKKIFIEDACPTKIGGQAVLEGIMMKSEDRCAVVVRQPSGDMYIKTDKLKPRGRAFKIPILRGVLIFVDSLVTGMKTLMMSAELIGDEDEFDEEVDENGVAIPIEESRFTNWLVKHFGERAPMTFVIAISVILALAFTVGIFIIGPTVVANLLGKFIDNDIILNLVEGVFRILLFVVYIVLVSKMGDIRTVFQFHGAEHQCIHCFEGGLELTPDNCAQYETLHPRCGTSFLMFVMIIALLLFSILGWPSLLWRILSRLLLIPVIAGLSYELLKVAGSHDNKLVRILSIPGLLLQKLTTLRPNHRQLEVAIASMHAVLVPAEDDDIEGICDKFGRLIPIIVMPDMVPAAGELYAG